MKTSQELFRPACLIVFLAMVALSFKSKGQRLVPIAGKWSVDETGSYRKDFVAVWNKAERRGYMDATNNGAVNGVTDVFGLLNDIPLSLDYTGDGRDELAFYRPSTREFFFHPDFSVNTTPLVLNVGNDGDKPFTGNWSNSAKDGFALYRHAANSTTHQIIYFNNINSSTGTTVTISGPNDDLVPIAGDWDGVAGDGYALYNPNSREIRFYQTINDINPSSIVTIGNSGDKLVTGDWNGDGRDEIAIFRANQNGTHTFTYFSAYNGSPNSTVVWPAQQMILTNIPASRQSIYLNSVPHTDFLGKPTLSYNSSASIFPKGIYFATSDAIPPLVQAGYNLAIIQTNEYPLTQTWKANLDATNNKLKIIPQWLKVGGYPLSGKFGGGRHLLGIGSRSNASILYYDTNGDNIPDKEKHIGAAHDIPFTGDWDGDGRDEIALYRQEGNVVAFLRNILDLTAGSQKQISPQSANAFPVGGNWDGIPKDGFAIYLPALKEIRFYHDDDASTPFRTRTFTNLSMDVVIAGNWDGDSKDGFAIYDKSSRNLHFYSDIDDTTASIVNIGNSEDVPIAGDWDNNGFDGFGLYRTDAHHSFNQFVLFNSITNPTVSATESFGHPLIHNNADRHVFGYYMADESSGKTDLLDTKSDSSLLSSFYPVFDGLNYNRLFFHTDIKYVSPEDNVSTNKWWNYFNTLGRVLSHDDYPISTIDLMERGAANAGDVQTITTVATTVEKSRLACGELRPNWYVAQTFYKTEAGIYKIFLPTPQQYRASIYTALIHGATGIVNFSYNNPASPIIQGISPSNNLPLWTEAARVNSEIDQLTPFLLSKSPSDRYSVFLRESPLYYEKTPVRCLLKKYGDVYVLLAVNMSKQPLKSIIQLPYSLAGTQMKIERLFDNAPVSIIAGAINEDFGPFAVHVYKFKPNVSIGGRLSVSHYDEPLVQEYVSVYPNPANSEVIFDVAVAESKHVLIEVSDSQGRLIYSTVCQARKGSVIKTKWLSHDIVRTAPQVIYYRVSSGKTVIESGRLVLEPE